MGTFEFTSPDGQKFRVTGPEGATEAQAFEILQQQISSGTATPVQSAPTQSLADDAFNSLPDFPEPGAAPTGNMHEETFMEDLGDRVGVVGDFVKGTLRDLTGADSVRGERTLGEQAHRGVGRGVRTVAGAIPKTASSIADILGLAGNFVQGGIDTGDRFIAENVFGRGPRPPAEPAFPTDNVQSIDALLSQVFPEPETFGERVVELGGEALLTGGLGGTALASSRVPKMVQLGDEVAALRPALNRPSITPTQLAGGEAVAGERGVSAGSFIDDIGEAFARNPKSAAAAEFGAGAGSQVGGELAADADADPVVRVLSALGGGIAGGLSPQALTTGGRAVGGHLKRAAEPLTPGGAKTRVARDLQAEARDPEAAAQAALDAPEGVTGARASEDPNLRRKERTVAAQDPKFADQVDESLAGAEQRTIRELTEGLQPPGQDPAEWQRSVVEAASPPGTTIAGTQPDEMLEESFQSFRQAYSEAEGFPVQTQIVQVAGGNVGLPEVIASAVADRKVLARQDVRESVEGFVSALYDDIAERGVPITKQADENIVQFDSSDMLDFRQTIRAEQRRLQSAGRNNPEAAAQAKLLKNVEDGITEAIESQLPENASTALRELDARYSDFKTVEDAVLRGTPGELNAQKLAQSIKMQSGSRGRVARGDTGELGQLAERGRDVTGFIGKKGAQDQTLERTMRTMSPEQADGARSDLVREIHRRSRVQQSDTGEQILNGNKLLKEIDNNESTLLAGGFQQSDINNMRRLARRLRMTQSPDPRPDTKLIDDHIGALMGLLSRIAGARSAQRIIKTTGTGSTGSLSITGFMAKLFDKTLNRLNVSSAEKLIQDAMQPTKEGRELLAALLTRSTASKVEIKNAQRRLNAWAAQAASVDNGEE